MDNKNKFTVTMESKWDGYCKNCKGKTKKGDLIGKEKGSGKWTHVRCPERKTLSSLLSGEGHAIEEGEGVLADLEKKIFIPSQYQQDIFDWAINASGNAVVEAVAGSGKTTTIVKLLDLLPKDITVLFVAFNKTIVAELRRRVPKNIRVATLNSLGYSFIRKLEEFIEMDGDKVSGILNEFWSISKNDVHDPIVRSQNRIKRAAMRKLVGLVKNTLTDYNDGGTVLQLISRYRIDMDEQMEQEVIERLSYVMESNNNNLEYVDFDDQIYLPVVSSRLKNKFDQFDFILGDEVQDWNAANIQLLLKCLAPGGRMLAVGDRFQSIHAFRGADANAIPHIIEALDAKTLPLSISYRCPSSHVARVQHLVPHIEAAEGALEGVIEVLKYEEMLDNVREGDMVVCRTNAPLVKPAFETIRRGKKAIIRGKDIGRELVNFVDRFQCDELSRLEVVMAEFTEHEMERYLRQNKEMQAEAAKERFETIVEVAKECKSVEELVTKLLTLFSDDNIGVVYSSMHRAKGLEARNVYQYKPELVPHPKAKTEEDLQQERNLFYVAGTRSLENLYLVSGEEDN
ncbi:MAG: ATP-dependent helicase [Casimicrobiaceae bacterium]